MKVEVDENIEVLKHHFIGGVYAKEMMIPEDYRAVSHRHSYDHMSVLSEGCVIVWANGKQETYFAPAVIEIKAGVEHEIQAVNGPAHWLCIHKTDCTDPSQVDEVLVEKVQHMRKLPFVVPVAKLREELEASPWLWNTNELRTRMFDGSPHRRVDDIWIRYRDWSEFDESDPESFSGPHESIWYPAYNALPSIEWILQNIIEHLGDFELGGVLITKVPPGQRVDPHSDAGRWHADYYNRKILVLVKSAPGQKFCYLNEEHEGDAGQVFEFDNAPVHWVDNDSDVDRISLIFATRVKQ